MRGKESGTERSNKMKVLKRAEQQNFVVDKSFYTEAELERLIDFEYITPEYKIFPTTTNDGYRVFASDLKEVKVVYNKEFGFYENIAVTKNGKEIHITLA